MFLRMEPTYMAFSWMEHVGIERSELFRLFESSVLFGFLFCRSLLIASGHHILFLFSIFFFKRCSTCFNLSQTCFSTFFSGTNFSLIYVLHFQKEVYFKLFAFSANVIIETVGVILLKSLNTKRDIRCLLNWHIIEKQSPSETILT